MANCALPVLLLSFACHQSTAEIFVLRHEAVPPAMSLKYINTFYAYSEQDSPDKSLGSPFIRFQGFSAARRLQQWEPLDQRGTNQAAVAAADEPHEGGYDLGAENPNSAMPPALDNLGLQIIVLPFKDLWRVINASKFCTDHYDVYRGKALYPGTLLLQDVADMNKSHLELSVYNIHSKMDRQIPILQTGTYSIVLSNCGDVTSEVNGSIIVRNSYGYLPGNEYRKLPLYKGLLLLYILLWLLWIWLCTKVWSALSKIQVFIGGVLLTGLIEAAIWCATLTDWNSTGFRPVHLNILAVFARVLKSVGSYLLALLASLGWCVWRSELECGLVIKAGITCMLLIIADFIHEYLLSFRQTRPIPITTIFVSWVPVALLYCIIYFWIVRALIASIDLMREQKQEEKLQVFERLWKIVTLALALAAVAMLIQAFDMTMSLDVRLHYQWLFSDANYHILYTSVLAVVMYLWAPGRERSAYGQVASIEVEAQIEHAEDDTPVAGDAVWAQEEDQIFGEDVEEAEDNTFWGEIKASNNKVAPEPDIIGLTVDDK